MEELSKIFIKHPKWRYTQNMAQKGLGGVVLGQGTPTAPILTNILMKEFDKKMYKFAKQNNGNYTRYADDILISTNKNLPLEFVKQNLKKSLKKSNLQNIRLNNKKTRKMSIGGKIKFLGLSLSADRKIGIDAAQRKKLLNSLILAHKTQNLSWLKILIPKAIFMNNISDKKIDLNKFINTKTKRHNTLNAESINKFGIPYNELPTGKKIKPIK